MLVLELGRRLARDGIIERSEDVFFLYLEELEPVRARTQSFDVARVIADRRTEYEHNRTLEPPAIVVGDFDPSDPVPPPNGNGSDVIRGLAVSAGQVTGPARIILRVDSYEEVKPGEILVVPFTDPGWSPYFVAAAGLVVDTGGLLSHGSIVAREYGLPAVVNTISATRRIKTGDTVTVDGTTGTVTIHPPDAPPQTDA
jgi:pyruvate,water dikinase